tara:strand:+ start:1527 stop:1808 length:282 start_codon:yes stop_codon:yes gene_type:complete
MTITITRNHQPYTVETWVIEQHSPVVASDSDPDWLKSRASNGWVNVTGRILNSTTTSRLFHATASRTVSESRLSAQMPARYLLDGSTYTTVAM